MSPAVGYSAVIGAAVVSALLLRWCVLDAVVVPSHSMERTLFPGDYVLVDKLVTFDGNGSAASASGFSFMRPVRRGDVVVFRFPGEKELYFVKRCVALSGDLLRQEGNSVEVTPRGPVSRASGAGSSISVPARGDVIRLTTENIDFWNPVIAGEGHSVEWTGDGTILIDGAATTSYTVERNYLFVVGDNRERSYDSRSWGFLPEENVIGEPLFVYWSVNPERTGGVLSSVRWDRIGTFVR